MRFPRFNLDLCTVIATFGDCPRQQVSHMFYLSAIYLLFFLRSFISAMCFLLSLNLTIQQVHAYKTSYISHQKCITKIPFLHLIYVTYIGVNGRGHRRIQSHVLNFLWEHEKCKLFYCHKNCIFKSSNKLHSWIKWDVKGVTLDGNIHTLLSEFDFYL